MCSDITPLGVHGYGVKALALHGSYSEAVPTEVAIVARGQAIALWETVSAGDRHACIINMDGALYCWGERFGHVFGASGGWQAGCAWMA